ncbi:hypothetical protein [Alkaliphilus crotonatoxidans]
MKKLSKILSIAICFSLFVSVQAIGINSNFSKCKQVRDKSIITQSFNGGFTTFSNPNPMER